MIVFGKKNVCEGQVIWND